MTKFKAQPPKVEKQVCITFKVVQRRKWKRYQKSNQSKTKEERYSKSSGKADRYKAESKMQETM